MADAKRDANSIPVLIAVSSADGVTPVMVYADPTTHRLLVTSTGSNPNMAFAIFDSSTSCSVGDGIIGLAVPATYNGLSLSATGCAVHTKGITGTMTIQIRRRRDGSNADMLSAKLTIGDAWSSTTATIDTSNDDVATGDLIYVDVDTVHSGTAALGLAVTLSFA